METSNPHWVFHFEVLARALKDLETTCTAKPDSPDFAFLRAEAPSIFAEAHEALNALREQVDALDHEADTPTPPPTAH
ncbi:MAG: hypothetical protein ACE37M_15670 [Henriciella sp.]